MNTATIFSTLLLALAPVFTSIDASAQVRLGQTIYGFGEGAKGLEGIPRQLQLDSAKLGTSANLHYSFGNPKSKLLVAFAGAPLHAPLPLAGAQVYLDPGLLLATLPCTTDANGSAKLPLGTIPNLRSFTGLTMYGQAFEVTGGSLQQSTAFAAQAAAANCTVGVQATAIVFAAKTGDAIYRSISVTPGCTYQVKGQSVALPAKGVTITGRTGVGSNKTVSFDHSNVAVGTKVSIQLEVWCTCSGVISQHFLFARGTK